MEIALNDIRKYMIENNIDNNLDTDHPIKSLCIYNIQKINDQKWFVYIKAPNNSIFQNGYFKISIDFPIDFPKNKPECRFNERIYHLNINPNSGHISAYFLNIWDKRTTISELLVGLFLVFLQQNPGDSYSGEMAREYRYNYNEFVRKAKEYVKKYASPTEEVLNIFIKLSENDINELKDKLNKSNKIIEKQKIEIQDLTNQINSFKNINEYINILKNEIREKDKEINQLLQKNNSINNNIINNNINYPKKQINLEDMRCVTFITTDQSLFHGIPCSGNDIFAEFEEKLYQEYPDYRETNNSFLSNGREILRFKTINDNKIGFGKPVLLVKPT